MSGIDSGIQVIKWKEVVRTVCLEESRKAVRKSSSK